MKVTESLYCRLSAWILQNEILIKRDFSQGAQPAFPSDKAHLGNDQEQQRTMQWLLTLAYVLSEDNPPTYPEVYCLLQARH